MDRITTITFFRLDSWIDRLWGMKMMGDARRPLKEQRGQHFFRLFGTGSGNGFTLFPDFSTYSLLQVWRDEECAMEFVENCHLMKQYRLRAQEIISIFLVTSTSHGAWDGVSPFGAPAGLSLSDHPVASITRATINPRRLLSFHRFVSRAEQPLPVDDSLLFKKGVSELPVLKMATFSIWKSTEAMRQYAYRSDGHRIAIERARSENWFTEELFARFIPYKTIGKWSGLNSDLINIGSGRPGSAVLRPAV